MLAVLILLGSGALMVVEGWGFFDALYMSVITLTTVGYHEVHELSTAGRVVVMLYLFLGIGVFLYAIVEIGATLVRLQLSDMLSRKKMDTAIRSLTGHLVICGYGRIGRSLCRQLAVQGRQKFVVLDRDQASVDDARAAGYLAMVGDATDDEVLKHVGVQSAAGLAVVMPSDADNLFVVLSARLLNRDLQILARATDDKSVAKLERAGANRVVSLYEAGATKMAQLLTHARVEDFMEVLTSEGDRLELAEIVIGEDAPYRGRRLNETDFRKQGILVVAHQKPGYRTSVPPPADALLEAGDSLIAFGDPGAIGQLIATARR